MNLRPYQRDSVRGTRRILMKNTRPKIIIDAPTGSGKSLMISQLCKEYPVDRIVIVTNITTLIGQLSEHLDEMELEHSILKAGMEDKFDPELRIQLVMEQTYHARKPKLNCSILIKDEYHIAYSGDRWNQMVSELTPFMIIGFTATPYDEYGVVIPDHDIIRETDIKKLTDDGYLLPMKTFIPKKIQAIDLSKIGKTGDYTESELNEVINTDDYNDMVVSAWKKLPRQTPGFMKTIGFVGGIGHAESLAEMFRNRGVVAHAVHSKQNPGYRSEIMKNFDGKMDTLEPDIEVVIGVSSLHTGYDSPDIECVINSRPTKRRSLFTQMTGRGIRTHPSLEYAIHLDCAQATATHGLYDEVFIPYDSKESLPYETIRREKRKALIDFLVHDYDDDNIPVAKKDIDEYILYLHNSTSLEALKAKYDSSQDAREMLDLGCDIYEKVYGIDTPRKTRQWIMIELEKGVKTYGLKTFKTRLRNIIRDGKKIASLYYFRKFLNENMFSR